MFAVEDALSPIHFWPMMYHYDKTRQLGLKNSMVGIETGTLQNSNRTWCSIKSVVDFCRASRSMVPLLILLNVSITIALAYKLNIWLDEAYTLHTTGQNVQFAFNQALQFELQPPLYFVLLNLWRNLSSSVFFARLFSVSCIALSIYVAAIVSRKYVNEMQTGWVVAAIAFHPFTIWAAVEIRVYAFLILLSALLLLLFHNGYFADVPRRSARWLYGLVAVSALYAQYYTGYLLVANACVLLILKRWLSFRAYLLTMVVVGFCFSPMLTVIIDQVPAHTETVKSVSFFNDLARVGWRTLWFLFPANWARPLAKRILSSEPGVVVAATLFVTTISLAVAVMFRNTKTDRPITAGNIAVWTVTAVVFLCFILTTRITGEKLVASWHMAILFLPLTLSVFSALTLIAKKRIMMAWTFITIFLGVTSLGMLCTQMAKPGDWSRVASYIMAFERTGQSILVFQPDATLPLAQYYEGSNLLVPIPRAPKLDTYDLRNNVLRSEQEISNALLQFRGGHEQVWLVTDNVCGYLDVDYNCHILEDFVSKYYSVERSATFFGSRVRLLHRRTVQVDFGRTLTNGLRPND